jgi:hypothetical protein
MDAEAYIEQARRTIAETARAMLAGRMSFIEGARALVRLRWAAELPQFDDDIMPFVGIDSQTDALPLGRVREHWAPASLEKLQPEIDEAERWAKEFGEAACRKLVERFSSAG